MTQQAFGDTPFAQGAPLLLGSNWGWVLFRGVLSLLFGILAFVFPFGAVFAFTALFAAYALVNGIMLIVAGAKGASAHLPRWWSLVLSGLLGVGVGVGGSRVLAMQSAGRRPISPQARCCCRRSSTRSASTAYCRTTTSTSD